jgi:hypothetical protein
MNFEQEATGVQYLLYFVGTEFLLSKIVAPAFPSVLHVRHVSCHLLQYLDDISSSPGNAYNPEIFRRQYKQSGSPRVLLLRHRRRRRETFI